jgi:hypothetical protein
MGGKQTSRGHTDVNHLMEFIRQNFLGLLALLVASVAAWYTRRTANETRRIADETRRMVDQGAIQERMRARPRLVPDGGSSGPDEHKFSFRNAGAPVGKLRLVGVDPPIHLNPPHHLGTGDKGYVMFPGKPALPLTVRVEYEDGLGNMDAMLIELREGHTFEVLSYDSDKEVP